MSLPKGKRPPPSAPLPERLAYRSISDALRQLADPLEIGKALLLLFAGKDPFTGSSTPDGMPTRGVHIDMNHRLAAIKLYLEYAYGKPLQGIAIDGQIRQQHVTASSQQVADLRSLAESSPEAKAALRQLAALMTGKPESGK